MARRSNRVARGLAAILAVTVLGGVGLLIEGTLRDGVVLLGVPSWGVESITLRAGPRTRNVGWMFSLGSLHFCKIDRSADFSGIWRSGTGQ